MSEQIMDLDENIIWPEAEYVGKNTVEIEKCDSCPVEPPKEIYLDPSGKEVELPLCELREEDAEMINRMIEYAVLHNAKLTVNKIVVPWQELDGLMRLTTWNKTGQAGSVVPMEQFRVEGGLEVLRNFLEKRRPSKKKGATSKSRG